MSKSPFIRPIHPKTAIRSDRSIVQKILDAGWIGQIKIHGHRAQIHISSDPEEAPIVYNRQGRLHKKELPEKIRKELRRLFMPETGWNVIDAEWLKPEEKIFVFDLIKKEGKILKRLGYLERWKMLPRSYISPFFSTLPVLTSLDQCMAVLARKEPYIEGLVFKSPTTPGFSDTSIIRCRKKSSLES